MADPLTCRKIVADPRGRTYFGLFPGDNAAAGNIEADRFEKMASTEGVVEFKVDFILEFVAFSTGPNFPTQSAKEAADKKRKLFIKLEPFNSEEWKGVGKGKKALYILQKKADELNQLYSLQKIIDGGFDGKLKDMAIQIRDRKAEVFISFGHEMNTNWYPWAGNPEKFKAAWKHIHKVMADAGACNISWVWAPNVGTPEQYYPGPEYVDWVGADGYNWDGEQPTSQIFSGTIEYLKTLGKPIMVAEFACAIDRPDCLTNAVEYFADPVNKIDAAVFFNYDKVERGALQHFAISTSAEQEAFKTAVKEYKDRFEGSIQSLEPEKIPAAVTPPRRKMVPLPEGFTQIQTFTPLALINQNYLKISESKSRLSRSVNLMNARNEMIRKGTRPIGRNPGESTSAFGENIIQWMFYRENGIPRNDLLEQSLSNTITPYWKTKIALLLTSGSPDDYQIGYIQRLGFDHGKTLTRPISRKARFDLLKEILENYKKEIKINDKGKAQHLEGGDPLIQAEIQLQLALLAEDENTSKRYFTDAGLPITYIKKQLEDIFSQFEANKPVAQIMTRNELLKTVGDRLMYLKAGMPVEDQIVNEILFYQGQILLLDSQLTLQKAGKMDKKQEEIFPELETAYKTLKKAVPYLEGMHYQEVKRQAAECLIRMGFIAKDLEGAPDLDNNPTLKEIQKWEADAYENNGKQRRNYETFFRAARRLLRDIDNKKGSTLDATLDWIDEYQKTLKKLQEEEIKKINKSTKSEAEKNKAIKNVNQWATPVWLSQIEAYSTIWEGKKNQVEILENRELPDYLRHQKVGLKEIEETLGSIQGLDPDIQADVITAMASAIAQQGFIDLSLVERGSAADHFKNITASLKGIVANASPQTRAEIYLLLANIAYVEAGNKNTIAERRIALREAKGYIVKPEIKILHGPLLSLAKQVFGEILLLEKRVAEARGYIEAAIGIFPQNYGARAVLVDIISQQGEHQEAITEYEKLLKAIEGAYPHPTLAARIKIGLAEAKMRLAENYNEENTASLEDLLFGDHDEIDGVLAKEAPGSFVVTRALNSLLETYGTNEDLHDQIALICKILLGRDYQVDQETEYLKKAFKPLQNLVKAYPRLEATVYLKLAEALIWRKRFDEANDLLENVIPEIEISTGKTKIPQKLLTDVIEKDTELNPWHMLIKAELEMRRERKVHPITDNADLFSAVLNQSELDSEPDLMVRLIFDHMEGLSYEKKFAEVIKAAKTHQNTQLEKITILFKKKGRLRSALKFRYKLWMDMAVAHGYHAGLLHRAGKNEERDKYYRAALHELTMIQKKGIEIDGELNLKLHRDLKHLYQAQIYVNIGDVYKSEWSGEDFQQAKKSYQAAIDLYKGQELKKLSKEDRLTLARAYFGLGELYRYGKNMKNYVKPDKEDYAVSLDNYRKALETAEKIIKKSSLSPLEGKQESVWKALPEAEYADELPGQLGAEYADEPTDQLGIVQPENLKSGPLLVEDFKKKDVPLTPEEAAQLLTLLRKAPGLPERSEDRLLLLTRVYHGLAKLEQQEGRHKQAMIYFKKSAKYGAKVPEDDLLQAELANTRTFLFSRVAEVKTESFVDFPQRGGSRWENRTTVNLRAPVENLTIKPFDSLYGVPTLGLRAQIDSTTEGSISSLYAGGTWRTLDLLSPRKIPGEIQDLFFNIEAMTRVPGAEQKSSSYVDTAFFRRPPLLISGSLGNNYFTLIGAFDLASFKAGEDGYPDDNSYFGAFKLNLSPRLVRLRGINLQEGLIINRYPITYSGQKEVRTDLYFAAEFNVDAAEKLFKFVNDYDVLKLRGNIGWPYFQYGGDFFADLQADGLQGNQISNPFLNFKIGLGVDWHAGQGVVLSADGSFVHQQNSQLGSRYDYGTVTLSAGW